MRTGDIKTPALIADSKILEANISTMASRRPGKSLRPHIKAFKSTELAKKLFPYEAYKSWKKIIEAHPKKMHPPVLSRFRGGMSISYNDYLKAWSELKKIRKSFLNKIYEILW